MTSSKRQTCRTTCEFTKALKAYFENPNEDVVYFTHNFVSAIKLKRDFNVEGLIGFHVISIQSHRAMGIKAKCFYDHLALDEY